MWLGTHALGVLHRGVVGDTRSASYTVSAMSHAGVPGFRGDDGAMSHARPGRSSIDSAAPAGHDARMTTPRRLLVDPVNACDYHLVSRCVQQAYLFGRDPATGEVACRTW